MYTNLYLPRSAKDWLALQRCRLKGWRTWLWCRHRGFHCLGEKQAFELASQRIKVRRVINFPQNY